MYLFFQIHFLFLNFQVHNVDFKYKTVFKCSFFFFLIYILVFRPNLTLCPSLSLSAMFCFSTELIYEEVIDWEERNKNGLMKEDCSGTRVYQARPACSECAVQVPLQESLNLVVF